METHNFQADAQQILKLVTHSIYSDKEVFLRELLSNASDALDKARFLSMQNESLRSSEEPSIKIELDTENSTITIEDDGVGMTRDEIIENLGTIAQSGTKSFSEKLDSADSIESLIGQFGVGFYSAFMVADKVVVESLSIQQDEKPILWESEGGASFALTEGSRETRGTKITLHINKEDSEQFCNDYQIKEIIKKHSEFIQWPILMEEERINQEKALWLRNPDDITEEEYNAFYKHITKNWDDPLCTIHIKGEGISEYNAILFIPKKHSFQLDNAGAGYKAKGPGSVLDNDWPVADETHLVEDQITYPISFNGKVRFKLDLPASLTAADIENTVRTDNRTAAQLDGKEIRKVIVVPGRIVNVVM